MLNGQSVKQKQTKQIWGNYEDDERTKKYDQENIHTTNQHKNASDGMGKRVGNYTRKTKKCTHTQTNKNCTEDHVRAERKPKRKRK